MFSHVGMLFREQHPVTGKNILYVWDSDLGQQTKDGPRVLELEKKLERYHGYPYLMWRRLNGKRPSTQSILNVVAEYQDLDFDHKILSWWVSTSPLLYRAVKSKDKVFCSELVAMTMQHPSVDMLDQNLFPAWYSPGTFAQDNIPGLKKNYSYSSRRFVKFRES